jgi:hypothetical protein
VDLGLRGSDLCQERQIPSVQGLGVRLVGELEVTCEISWMSWQQGNEPLAVRVVFPEDARGLFELCSWNAGGGVADAMTEIAVGYLSGVLASGALATCGQAQAEPERADTALVVRVSSMYVRIVLNALALQRPDRPRHDP